MLATKTSLPPLVSPATRFDASEQNAIASPSSSSTRFDRDESATTDDRPFASPPACVSEILGTLTRRVPSPHPDASSPSDARRSSSTRMTVRVEPNVFSASYPSHRRSSPAPPSVRNAPAILVPSITTLSSPAPAVIVSGPPHVNDSTKTLSSPLPATISARPPDSTIAPVTRTSESVARAARIESRTATCDSRTDTSSSPPRPVSTRSPFP